jgi:YD repeat-containing protein
MSGRLRKAAAGLALLACRDPATTSDPPDDTSASIRPHSSDTESGTMGHTGVLDTTAGTATTGETATPPEPVACRITTYTVETGAGLGAFDTYYYADLTGYLERIESDSLGDGSIDNWTSYTYDAQGRMVTDCQDGEMDGVCEIGHTWTYDDDGNVLTKHQTGWRGLDVLEVYTYENGDPTTYEYIMAGRTDHREWYTHDAAHHLLTWEVDHDVPVGNGVDLVYTYTWDGDLLDTRLEHVVGEYDGLLDYTYDARGNNIMEELFGQTRAGNWVCLDRDTRTYDAQDRLLTYDSWTCNGAIHWGSFVQTWDASGDLIEVLADNGSYTRMIYDEHHNLLEKARGASFGPLETERWTWDCEPFEP